MKLSLSSSRRRPPSPACLASLILAAAVGTQFRLCWRGKCVGRNSIERPCWNCRGPRGAVSRMLEEERITEQASDVVEDPWGLAETVAENFKVSTLAVGVRLKAIGLISDADSEGVRVEVIGSGNLGGEERKKTKGEPPAWRLRFRDPDSEFEQLGTERQTKGRAWSEKGHAWSTQGRT